MRGVSLKFLVLDEYADMKPDVFEQILRPALADQKGCAMLWCVGCVWGILLLLVVTLIICKSSWSTELPLASKVLTDQKQCEVLVSSSRRVDHIMSLACP